MDTHVSPTSRHRRAARGLLAKLSRRLAFLGAIVLAGAPIASPAQTFLAEWTERDIAGIGPTGMAIDTIGGVSYLYVSDENHGRIIKYNLSTGSRVDVWGSNGTGDGQLNSPYGIAIDPVSHDVYVAERGNHRVQRFTSNGTFVMKWGSLGTGAGQFDGAIGVAADASGNVYVTDHNNSRVQKFHVQFNGSSWEAQFAGTWGSQGSGAGQFYGIYGITLDKNGVLWVADGFNHRLQKFDTNGNFLGAIGTFGTGNGQFVTPTWVNFDSSGNYYVAETNSDPTNTATGDIQNQRIQKFSPAGVFLNKWGSYGEAGGQFRLPFDIVIDNAGFAYVADYYNTRVQKFDLTATPPLPIPSQSVAVGASATFSVTAGGNPSYQWQRNGVNIFGANSASLTIGNVQPSDAGVYTVVVTNGNTTASQSAVLAVTSALKISGTASEVGTDIHHPSGNIYDQILLQGAAATIRADPGQVTRISYIDLTDDIVQVEFSGAGNLTLVLDNASGPATPVNYNQNVAYVKGHATIVITGANQSTNVSVFSVGRANAVNQALFRDNVNYDSYADIATIAIVGANGQFGGVRTANAHYLNTAGVAGLHAPGVQFTGPVYICNISAADACTPEILLGSISGEVQINGGDLFQPNGRAVQVSGIPLLRFVDGSTSAGVMLPAQPNRARIEQNGIDVTAQIVSSPP
jgi:sugar lactone lactonase YvrE